MVALRKQKVPASYYFLRLQSHLLEHVGMSISYIIYLGAFDHISQKDWIILKIEIDSFHPQGKKQ